MSKLSEEEIIEYIKDEIEIETDTYHWFDDTLDNKTRKQIEERINAHQGLLDLYQKEKEKNKELSEKVTQNICNRVEAEVLEEYRLKVQNSISKDKIKEKIEELEAMSISKDIYYDDILKMLQELLEERN